MIKKAKMQRPHDTVILNHATREEVHRYEGSIALGLALRQYAQTIGADMETIAATKFGTTMKGPDGRTYRATYRPI